VQLPRRRGDRAVARDGVDDAEPVDIKHGSTLSIGPLNFSHWTKRTIEPVAEGAVIRPRS
jgi:hypothetical protein